MSKGSLVQTLNDKPLIGETTTVEEPLVFKSQDTPQMPEECPFVNTIEGELEERKPNPFYISLLLNG